MANCELTPKQAQANQLLGGSQRHTLLVGGSRSGKTFLFIRAILIRALRSPGSRHAVLRFRAAAVRQSIWLDTLPRVQKLCFPDISFVKREQYGFLTLPNGSEIWVGGLDDKERVEKILGQEYASIFFNECSQIPYFSIVTALTRLAQKCEALQNRAYYDLNPTGTGHWSYRLFIEKKSPDTLQPLADPDNYAHLFLNPSDNRENIDPAYLASLQTLPEKQRRRFFDGVYVAELDGALWSLEGIDRTRVAPEEVPDLRRIVVAIDPSGARGEFDMSANEIGIVAAGLGFDNQVYVLQDRTLRAAPEKWGRTAIELYHELRGDSIVGETNFGGDMVRAVVHGIDPNVSFRPVSASRGKAVRAEPVASLYDQGRVHHVGRFAALEEELTNFTTAGYVGSGSPNHADALVWAVTELSVDAGKPVYNVDVREHLVDDFPVPDEWPRGYALDPQRAAVLWAALNPETNCLYLHAEHLPEDANPILCANAILASHGSAWMQGIASQRSLATAQDGRTAWDVYSRLGLQLVLAVDSPEGGIQQVQMRLDKGQLKAFRSLTRWRQQFVSYHRRKQESEYGAVEKIVEKNCELMDCMRDIALSVESLKAKPTPEPQRYYPPRAGGSFWGR